jgi:carboxymethylenebutenolidase
MSQSSGNADSPLLSAAVLSSLLLATPALAADNAKFAAAVQPVAASTLIATDSQNLAVGEARIPVAGGELPVYWARPQANQHAPVILVVQEIFGVHEHIRDICRRLAKQGYYAIAPELYFRQGDVAKLASIDEIRPIVAKVPDAQVLADLDAAAAWAGSQGADAERLGLTGFCWGGRIAWLYAAHQPKLKAAVAWYGRLGGDSDPLHPQNPLELAAAIKPPVLGLYGGQDQGIPLASVQQMQAALKKAGSHSRIEVYPDAPHAFHADYRPSYRKEAASDGWNKLLAWFAESGLKP